LHSSRQACASAEALNHGGELLVEAGTGVGKSLAYLLPAAQFALRNGERVVVSTNTINLQAQLMGQDIPTAQRLLSAGDAQDGLRAAQLKGRRNYLCLLRWANLRHASTLSEDEAKLLVRLLLWLPHTDIGDRGELRLSPGEEAVWNRLSAQQESCLAAPCAFVKDGSCFLLRARRRAEAAHVLVVNHALLLSDIAVGGGVIPEYQHLIVDEAQHLESEATAQFERAPEFVVLFLPGDQFLSAALDQQPDLLESAMKSGVILATPSSFMALLKAVHYGWQNVRLAEGAEHIRRLAEDLYSRLGTFRNHLARLGSALENSVRAFNASIGSLERNVLPGARKFTELGVRGDKTIEELEAIEVAVRANDGNAPELPAPEDR